MVPERSEGQELELASLSQFRVVEEQHEGAWSLDFFLWRDFPGSAGAAATARRAMFLVSLVCAFFGASAVKPWRQRLCPREAGAFLRQPPPQDQLGVW